MVLKSMKKIGNAEASISGNVGLVALEVGCK